MLKPIAKITDLKTAKDKNEKGAISAEWQILGFNKFIEKEVFDTIKVTSIHSCLKNHIDIELDNAVPSEFVNKKTTEYHNRKLNEAFALAEYAAMKQGFDVKVVVHLNNDKIIPYEKMTNYISNLLKKYQNTKLAIENIMMINSSGTIRPAYESDSVSSFVKEIRKRLEPELKERVGTVLDICHAYGSIRMKNLLLNNENDETEELNELEKYFNENKDICFICHFNNLSGTGIKKGHGIGFINDQKNFDNFIKLYEKYIPNADLVIEIREDDYSNAINFKDAVKKINEYNKNT